MQPFATFTDEESNVVATAIHCGHRLRPSLAPRLRLDESDQRREEDPHTDVLLPPGAGSVIVRQSRFEVDLNRPREKAVYRTPEEAWGLDLWQQPLPACEIACSMQEYDDFYGQLGDVLDETAERGPFVVLDVHSYNHRRGGPCAAAAEAAENPEVNLGTASLDRDRWGRYVDHFKDVLGAQTAGGHALDARENVRFQGGNMSRWVNARYEGRGFAIALEFKKVFMDEWSGEVDDDHLRELAVALEQATSTISEELTKR